MGNFRSRHSEPTSSENISSVPDVVSVEWLAKHKNSVVILDATFDVKPKPDPEEFKQKHYAQFEKLMIDKPKSYVDEHIPGAALFSIDAAYYPSECIRFDLYPPEEFEKFVRLLGVHNSDHVVLYGRGPFGGMLWAGRAWWTFKLYGHDKVSVLNGGLDAWKSAGQPVTNDIVVVQPSDWTAKPFDLSRIITFEELNKKQTDGKSLFEKLDSINYVDARPAGQFNGTEPMGVAAEGATGAHVKGAKNIPLAAVVTEKGLKPKEEIKRVLKNVGFNETLPTVAGCAVGGQASLLAMILSHVGIKAKVFNGSMTEVGLRAPELISEKNT